MDNIDLQKYIQQSGISADILTMNEDVHSVLAASKELGRPPSSFIKSIVFVTSENETILAIVKGTDRASSKRIGKILGIESPKLGTPEEALKQTGYEVGGNSTSFNSKYSSFDRSKSHGDGESNWRWRYKTSSPPNITSRNCSSYWGYNSPYQKINIKNKLWY